MAGEVTDIEHPATIGAGTITPLKAVLAPGAADLKKLKWTYTEPSASAKPQPLTVGTLVATYIPPSRLVGKKITITAKSGKTAAHDVEIPIVREAATLPTATVKCQLPPGWRKELADHAVIVNAGVPFLVGRRAVWKRPGTKKRYVGLTLSERFAHATFDPDDYPTLGHWPELVSCSTELEGRGAFEALNTYDHTNFTFGLIQFSARSYGADFHAYLRNAFRKYPTEAAHYFPELKLTGDDFHGLDPKTGQWLKLTDSADPYNAELRRFIKPVDTEVTQAEVLFAGRMVHWIRAGKGMRTLMVDMAIERAKAYMKTFAASLDGKGIAECAVVFDIRLHGRDRTDGFTKIRNALKSAKPLDELLAIHDKPDKARMDIYKKVVAAKFAGSQVKYDKASNDLIAPGDA